MATVSTLIVALTAQTTDFERGLKSAEKALDRTAARFESLGASMSAGLTAPLAALATAAAKLAVDFDAPFDKMQAVLGQSAKETDALRDSVLRLAGQTAQSPKELGAALYDVEAAGIRGTAAMDVLRAAAEASAIGLGSVKGMTSFLSAELNAYGPRALSAAQATSVLIEAARVGRVNIDQLVSSVEGILPLAAQAGVSFDQITAAMAAMTRSGLDAGQAAMGLRTVLTTIEKPSAAAQKSLAMVGLSAAGLKAELASNGLLATLDTLKTAFQGQDEALAQLFPNARTFAGVMSLIGANSSTTTAIFQKLAGTTTGTLDKALQNTAESGAFKLQQALIRMQTALIRLGNDLLPVIVPLVERFGRAVQQLSAGFEGLDAGSRDVIVVVAALAAALGPTLLAFSALYSAAANVLGLFRLFLGMSGLANVFSAAQVGASLLAGAIGELLGYFQAFGVVETVADVILPALAGSALLAGGLAAVAAYLWISKWQEMKTDMGEIAAYLQEKLSILTESTRVFGTAINLLVNPFSLLLPKIEAAMGGAATAAASAGGAIKTGVLSEVSSLQTQAAAIFDSLAAKAKSMAASVIGAVQSSGGAAEGGMGAAGSAGFMGPRQQLPAPDLGLWSQIGQTMQEQGSVVDVTFRALKQNALDAAQSFNKQVGSMVGSTEQSMGAMTAALLMGKESFGTFVRDVIQQIETLIVKILLLKALTAAGMGGPFASGLVGGISLGPGHAAGGPVSPGTMYPVGERGPEMFVPDTAGRIVPNSALGGGGTQVTVNQTVQITGMDLGSEDAAKRLAIALKEQMRSGAAEGVALALQSAQLADQNSGRSV